MKGILGALIVSLSTGFASAATITNGDFETGDLSGWAATPTQQGQTGFSTVSAFDTTGTGFSSAATFRVGRLPNISATAGIDLSQTISILIPGTYSFALDVAALDSVGSANADGGLFELIVGGALLDTVDFGRAEVGVPLRGSLAGSLALGAGDVDLVIRIRREFAQGDGSPLQYVDNVTVSAPAPVPLPAALPLLLLGVGSLHLLRRRSTGT